MCLHESLGAQLATLPFLGTAAEKDTSQKPPKPVVKRKKEFRHQPPKKSHPSPHKAAKQAAKAAQKEELENQRKETESTPSPNETGERPEAPWKLQLLRLPRVLFFHNREGVYDTDTLGDYIQFREHDINVRVRGDLGRVDPHKLEVITGNLSVRALLGKDGRRFICAEFELCEEGTEAVYEMLLHLIVFERPASWLSTFCTPDEGLGGLSIYRRPLTEPVVQQMAA